MQRIRNANHTAFCGMPPQKAAMVFGIVCFVAAILGIVMSAVSKSGYLATGYGWCGLVLITAILAIVAYFFSSDSGGFNVSILYIIALILNGIDILLGFLCLILLIVFWATCGAMTLGLGGPFCMLVGIFSLLITLVALALYCAFEWCLWLAYLAQKDLEAQRFGGVVIAPNPGPAAMPPPTTSSDGSTDANPAVVVVV